MPANEQTWRQAKWLHVLFGVSALAMLGATIWMLAEDHNRQWKQYQRDFRTLDRRMTEARLDSERNSDYERRAAELEEQLAAEESSVPDKALLDEFGELVTDRNPNYDWASVESSYESLAEEPSPARRSALLDQLRNIILSTSAEEENASRKMKFARAELDVVRSKYEIAIGEGASATQLGQMQRDVDEWKNDVSEFTAAYQEVNHYRRSLESIVKKITLQESETIKQIDELNSEAARLRSTIAEQTLGILESIPQLPILDAFNNPYKIHQDWLPNLTITYGSFGEVARFDRCATCHQGIGRTAPGSSTEPAFEQQHTLSIELPTPEDEPVFDLADGSQAKPTIANINDYIEAAYGMRLAPEGFLNPNDVTVYVVLRESAAARAGLQMGDVISKVADAPIRDKDEALEYLVRRVRWGEPLELTILRGYPQPYSSHPRLDLFLGSTSPHKQGDFGCTICHEGQGSATDFRWAAHTPNSPLERESWRQLYGWVNNHYAVLGITHLWDFPMLPERFAESSCLKCHHQVVELEPSERFSDPPAPKLMKGYELITTYGCFGCHEINGFEGPGKTIGPDIRTEPNFVAAAQELLIDPGLSDIERDLAHDVIADPNLADPRTLLAELISEDRRAAAEDGQTARLTEASHSMAEILGADVETPGTYRRVGPSLRYIGSKVGFDFLYDWIQEPKRFRPTTRMPQFFGLFEHLAEASHDESEHAGDDDDSHAEADHSESDHAGDDGDHGATESSGLHDAMRFEPIEIFAMATYLMEHSQNDDNNVFQLLDFPEGASAERGKNLFQTRGCLACHQHKDFPEADYPRSTFGPNLSRIGAKLKTNPEEADRWLYTWLRNPSQYHTRTKMPDLFLEPITEEVDGQERTTDPAADITAYLVESSEPWQPISPPDINALADDVEDLALEYLTDSVSVSRAQEFLASGIPERYASEMKVDERVLLGEKQMSMDKKLEYLGRKSLSKYGCAGCHDIPGFENAKPVGTGLADWGRKETSRLAFEQIHQLLATPAGGLPHGNGKSDGHGIEVKNLDPDTGFFVHALMNHRRDGFIWQKLRAPRSYDYKKTENKGYNERLRMPKFPFTDEEIEAVTTFVLGLVSEPPAEQYVYQPDPRREAIVQGTRVLETFNCAACHTLEMNTWDIDFDPDTFASEFGTAGSYDWPFLTPHFTPEQIAASKQLDSRGLGHATIHGKPIVNAKGELVVDEHPDDGYPVNYIWPFDPVLLNGETWLVGEQTGGQMVPEHRITKRRPPHGGDFARFLYPLALTHATDPGVKESDAWGWVPPPLIGEGKKVQTGWLHRFLLNPHKIRPAALLRMPKFNMSQDDAGKLVRYFAAKDNAHYPFQYDPRRQENYLSEQEAEHPDRLRDAFRLVTDNVVYCGKCHFIGDYVPPGAVTAHAPNLEDAHERIRPDFMRRWLAKPASELPYTVMPENFKNAAPPEIFDATREVQLEAVVDLLLNYDTYMKRQTSIASQVKPAPEQPATDTSGSE